MRRKWIGRLIVLLLLALFTVLYVNNESNKTADAENSAEIDSKPQLNIQLPVNKQAKTQESKKPLDLSPKDEINGIPMSAWLAEIKKPMYSDDPVIEVASLGVDFRVCNHSLQRLTEKTEKNSELTALKDQLKDKCEAYAKQYPLLFKAHNQHENILNLPTNSLFGEQFKHILAGFYGKHNDLNYDQLLVAQFELSLQVKSPSLISSSSIATGIGLIGEIEETAFFMDLLKTHINIWVYEAHNLALQSLSCNLPNSRSCEATSFYMLYKCDNETSACGLTFQQWYESYTTAGMKKDVEILLQYYRENY